MDKPYIQTILKLLNLNIIAIDLDGIINTDYSIISENLFHKNKQNDKTLSSIFPVTSKQNELYKSWFLLIKNRYKTISWDKLVRLAPLKEIKKKDSGTKKFTQYYHLFYTFLEKLPDIDSPHIIIVIKNETKSVQKNLEIKIHESKYKNEINTFLIIAHTSTEELVQFIDDTILRSEQQVVLLKDLYLAAKEQRLHYKDDDKGLEINITEQTADKIFVDTIFRNIHTIKGNSATFGFDLIASYSHEIEDLLELLKPPIAVRKTDTISAILVIIDKIQNAINDVKDKIQLLFGQKDKMNILVPQDQIKHIHTLCLEIGRTSTLNVGTHIDSLIDACLTLSWKPLNSIVRKYQKLAEKTARNTNKSIVFAIEGEKELFPPDSFVDVDDILIHIIRNCIDHGIENNDMRKELRKGLGIISFEYNISDLQRTITISDDGAGINTKKLVASALREGCISADQEKTFTEEERMNLIFLPGITTAKKITNISGRGVGMDVVKHKVENLNGSIQIKSEFGKGTTFIISLPIGKK